MEISYTMHSKFLQKMLRLRLERLKGEISEEMYLLQIPYYDRIQQNHHLQQGRFLYEVVGSLVIGLPSPGSGGDLVIYDENKKVLLLENTPRPVPVVVEDKKKSGPRKPRVLYVQSSCIAFYPELFHEVEEVTHGYRLTLSFHVQIVKKDHRMKTQDWVRQMVELCFDRLFEKHINRVKQMGFILEGKYSMSDYANNTYNKSQGDASLINLLGDKYIIRMVPVVLHLEEYGPVDDHDDEENEDEEKREINVFLNTAVFKYSDQMVWDLSNVCFIPVGKSCRRKGDVGSGALSRGEVEHRDASRSTKPRAGTVNNFYYSFALIASVKRKYWLAGRKIMRDVRFHFK